MRSEQITTRIIKTGKSDKRFFLFTGGKRLSKDLSGEPFFTFLVTIAIAFVAVLVLACVYAFFEGHLG